MSRLDNGRVTDSLGRGTTSARHVSTAGGGPRSGRAGSPTGSPRRRWRGNPSTRRWRRRRGSRRAPATSSRPPVGPIGRVVPSRTVPSTSTTSSATVTTSSSHRASGTRRLPTTSLRGLPVTRSISRRAPSSAVPTAYGGPRRDRPGGRPGARGGDEVVAPAPGDRERVAPRHHVEPGLHPRLGRLDRDLGRLARLQHAPRAVGRDETTVPAGDRGAWTSGAPSTIRGTARGRGLSTRHTPSTPSSRSAHGRPCGSGGTSSRQRGATVASSSSTIQRSAPSDSPVSGLPPPTSPWPPGNQTWANDACRPAGGVGHTEGTYGPRRSSAARPWRACRTSGASSRSWNATPARPVRPESSPNVRGSPARRPCPTRRGTRRGPCRRGRSRGGRRARRRTGRPSPGSPR